MRTDNTKPSATSALTDGIGERVDPIHTVTVWAMRRTMKIRDNIKSYGTHHLLWVARTRRVWRFSVAVVSLVYHSELIWFVRSKRQTKSIYSQLGNSDRWVYWHTTPFSTNEGNGMEETPVAHMRMTSNWNSKQLGGAACVDVCVNRTVFSRLCCSCVRRTKENTTHYTTIYIYI